MNLKKKKRMIASLAGVGKKRVKFYTESPKDSSHNVAGVPAEEVKNAITKSDARGLIKRGAVIIKQKKGVSRARARKILTQKRKGRQKGSGSRKGKQTARLPKKQNWMIKIRAQRKLLNELKTKNLITTKVARMLYKKAKGGFFRNRRHIKVYLEEHGLVNGKTQK